MVKSSDIRKTVGNNLKRLRNSKKLSQEKLAELVDMDRESISSIELGRSFVSSDSLAKLANFFNVEPEYFFKQKPIEHSGKDLDFKKEINRLLSGFTSDELILLYKITASFKS